MIDQARVTSRNIDTAVAGRNFIPDVAIASRKPMHVLLAGGFVVCCDQESLHRELKHNLAYSVS
jgi:hypothetical protein